MNPDVDGIFNMDEVSMKIVDLITEAEGYRGEWSDVENSLGDLNLEDYLDDYKDEENDFKTVYMYEDLSKNFNYIFEIKKLLAECFNTSYISSCTLKHVFLSLLMKMIYF